MDLQDVRGLPPRIGFQNKFADKELRDKLIKIVRESGLRRTIAAQAVGINRKTLYDWLQRGKTEIDPETGQPTGPYGEFLVELGEAEAVMAQEMIQCVTNAAKEDPRCWPAAMTFLERTFPEEYALSHQAPPQAPAVKIEIIEVGGAAGGNWQRLNTGHPEFNALPSEKPIEGEVL